MWQWLTTHAMTLATLVTAGATLALVFITAWYAYLTGRLVKETQAARAPTLFVDLEFDSHVAKLVIGNVGDSGAHDLRFTVKDSMPLRDPRPSDGIQEVAAIKRGVSYLAPRRRLKFWLGLVDWDRLKQTGGSLDCVFRRCRYPIPISCRYAIPEHVGTVERAVVMSTASRRSSSRARAIRRPFSSSSIRP